MKNSFLVLSIALLGCAAPKEDVAKPNLLFILTDEQRFDTSAPYGNDKIMVPNLNKMGEEGIVFQNAYVSQPVCSPARSTILTGLYPHTNGVISNNIPLAEEFKTLPELIEDADYSTAYIGKWHLGRELDAWHGFDVRISTEDSYTLDDTAAYSDYQRWLIDHGYEPAIHKNYAFSRSFAANLPYKYSKTKFMELEAIEYMENYQNTPFVLYLSFLEPHSPNNGPFNDLHDTTLVELDSTYDMEIGKDMPLRYQMKKGYRYEESTRKVFANYWGLVHQVDISVGAILGKLKALELEDNTIVVFTSEHGKMMRKFGLTGKTVMYEQSSRIPWIMKIPGIKPALITQRVSQIDLVPTLLDAMHQPIPIYLQGKSLLPLIRNETTTNDPVFMEWNPFPNWQSQMKDCPEWATESDCEKAVRTKIRTVVTQQGWKLNWSSSDKSQLFNLNDDPMEIKNLYEDEKYQEQIDQLKNMVLAWQKRTHDRVIFDTN